MGIGIEEGIGLSYRPARLAESIPWNRFLCSLKVEKYRLWDCAGFEKWKGYFLDSWEDSPDGRYSHKDELKN
jgi:hypothetical protein